MRTAEVFVNSNFAGILFIQESGHTFEYNNNYQGPPVSLTMPITKRRYNSTELHPFFEGLLPEGRQLEILLKEKKIDKNDLFSQLVTVGSDLVGNVTVKEKI